MSTIYLQPWSTFTFPAGMNWVQDEEGWLDTYGYNFAVININAPLITASTTLKLETAEYLDAGWESFADITSSTLVQQHALSRDIPRSESSRLKRYLRWTIDGSGAGARFETCFRIAAQLKR